MIVFISKVYARFEKNGLVYRKLIVFCARWIAFLSKLYSMFEKKITALMFKVSFNVWYFVCVAYRGT